MKIEFYWNEGRIVVTREDTDPKYYGTQFAKGEHALFHAIKKQLQTEYGYDVIKKRAQKDGHMIGDEYQPYIRTRSKKKGFMIYSGFYAVRGANEDFNNGSVELFVTSY